MQAAVHLSPAAVEHVRRFLAKDPQAVALRFGVKRTGCSGWGYVVDIAHERRDEDVAVDQDGLTVLIDADSLPLVQGTVIDFKRQGLNQQFVFDNPRAAAACGCGESFTTAA